MSKPILRIVFFVFITLFFLKGVYALDPDFGWHLRMGQVILTAGIPPHDPFSYTMSSYPFIDHEWLTDVVIFLLYKIGKITTVSFFFTAVCFLIIWVLAKDKKNKSQEILFLIAASLIRFGGVRPQVLGWLFFVIWIKELLKKRRNNCWLFFLQLVWVNMHGSFFLGIGTYVLYEVIEAIEKRKIKLSSVLMCLVLFVATFINPYTYRIWWEVFMTLTDGSLRWRIVEWIPGILVFDLSFWIYACIFFSLFITFHKKLTLFQKIITVSFFLMALLTARNMPLFLLVSVDAFFVLWSGLESSIPAQNKKIFILLKRTIIGFCLFVSLISVCLSVSAYKPINKTYPSGAVLYLKQNKINGNIFSLYEWGGYLIWKLPNSKVFVDGRMPSWRWKQGDTHQSNNADKEYREILKKKNDFDYYKIKYHITYALVDKNKDRRPLFKKYEKLYEDETAILYKL